MKASKTEKELDRHNTSRSEADWYDVGRSATACCRQKGRTSECDPPNVSLIRIASKIYRPSVHVDLSNIDANVRNGSRVGGVGEHSPRNVGHAHKC